MAWGAIIGGIAGAVLSNSGGDASSSAASTQAGEAARQFNITRGDTAPYREAGQNALLRLSDLLGLQRPSTRATSTSPMSPEVIRKLGLPDPTGANPGDIWTGHGWVNPRSWAWTQDEIGQTAAEYYKGAPVYSPELYAQIQPQQTSALPAESNMPVMTPEQALQQTPGYQFRLDQGNRALAAATAKYRGTPRALKELDRYNQDYASNEYGKTLESMFRLSGIGGNAVNTSAGAGATAAGQIGNAAQFGAAGQIAANAGINNSIQGSLGNYYTMKTYNDMLSRMDQARYPTASSYNGVGSYSSPY